MQQYINYINSALPDKPGDKLLFKFKRKVLDEMNSRAIEVSSRGIQNQKVVDDLVMSEHPDLKEEYATYYMKESSTIKTKRKVIANIIGSAVYILALVVLFLGVSFATHAWSMTWAIIVDGILLWTAYILFLGVNKFTSMKRIFHIFARICLAGAVIIIMVAIYLFTVAMFDLDKSWVLVIAGLALMFVSDGIYASAAKHRLAVITWIIYIPIISVFLFVIIGALGILAWKVAWIIIPLSLVVDLAVILIAIAKNKIDDLEVEDIWKEN